MLLLLLLAGVSQGEECRVNPDGGEWPDWPPILTDLVGDFLQPSGVEGARYLAIGALPVLLACPGADFLQEAWGEGPLAVTCSGGEFTVVSGGQGEAGLAFPAFGCRGQPMDTTGAGATCGPEGRGTEIAVGFDTDPSTPGTEATTLTLCHDLQASATLWTRHTLFDEIAARDHGNDSPPFNPDTYFAYDVNHFYTMDQQRRTIAELVGSQELAEHYVQDFNSGLFLARGHLSPNADFPFYSIMDSTYHFVNVAPQWQAFNGGNWMYFEIGVRDFAVARGLDLVIWTGTHGVCELEDVRGEMVDIHLYGGLLPVPRFYWKIIYSPELDAGVAVVGVNNPHLTAIPPPYLLCEALGDHPLLENVFHPDDIERGYMWACRVEDLDIPELASIGLPPMQLLN